MNHTLKNAPALREQGESDNQNKIEQTVAEHYGEVSRPDLSTDAQRQRLLDALRRSPVTTLEARRNLEILHPAMRVLELKRLGHRIDTVIIHQATETGIKHRVAKYVLQPNSGVSQQDSDHGSV